MRNRIIFLFFLAAMLCFGINNVKAQSDGDQFSIEYDNYALLYTIETLNPNTVSVECDTDWYYDNVLDDIDGLNIPETVTDDNGNVYTVTKIAQSAFENLDYFTGQLNLPNTITSIGDHAFEGTSFNGVIIIPETVKSIGFYAFFGCNKITGIVLPQNITKIESSCFYNCSKLNSIELNDEITSIGSHAFYGCRNLESIKLPQKVKTIGDAAFSQTGLTSIILHNNIEEIGKDAFSTKKSNKQYTLNKVMCNLTSIPKMGDEMGEYGFGGEFNPNLKIYVPASSYDEYINAQNWSYYKNYIVALPTFVEDGSLNDGDNWIPSGVPSSNVDVFINAEATIDPTESFSTNTFGICENGKITIEEGGQLIHNGSEDVVTVKKRIESYVIGEDGYLESGWYTISSPFGDLQLSSSNFINNEYELFRYNESIYEWENHKNPEHVNDFTTLEAGRGYIYANADSTNISITERLNTENKSYKMTASSDILKGFNLVGNPFMHNIYKGSGCAIDNGNLAEGFYTLSNEGAWHAKHNEPIKPMESILVKTTAAGTLNINKTTRSSAARALNNGLVTINVSNEKHSDVAYVTFNGGIGLDKISHRNSNIPMVYVPMDNVDYAIAVMDKEVTEIPVNFEAMKFGEYTISVSSTACNYDEITLIDKQTGEETNMLTGDYKFLATTNDNPERFLIKVSIDENNEAEFFTDGSNIFIDDIEGSGVVQIYDVMGRLIIKQNTSGSNCQISSSSMANGVYVISLTDDNGTTTKKILINNK